MITTKNNIMNNITKYVISFIISGTLSYFIYKNVISDYYDKFEYNFVELQMRFKRYLLVDKYERKNKYIFILENPITKERKKINVTQAMYTNVYFIGDTIK